MRTEDILAAFKTELEADGTFEVLRAHVDALSGELQQIPAVCIFMGEAEPRGELDGFEVIGKYRERLTVACDCWDRATREDNVETKLLDLRRRVHAELMGSTRLGLSYVINLAPLGAEEPELSGEGTALVGKLRTLWLVEYETSVTALDA